MATVKINSGSGRAVSINSPGQPSTIHIEPIGPTPPEELTGEVPLAGSSGLSSRGLTGSVTNFEIVDIVGYQKVMIAGTVDRVRFNLLAIPAGTYTHFHVRVWRKDVATYDLIGQVDILKASLIAGINDHANSSPFSVQVGDYVGLGVTGQMTDSKIQMSFGMAGDARYNLSYPNSSTGMNWDGQTTSTAYPKITLAQDSKTYLSGRRGFLIGDSTTSDWSGTGIADLLLTESELQSGYVCYSIATGGDSTNAQRTKWNATNNPTQYDWVVIQIGLNDMNPAEAASVAIARIQTLVDDIRADAPDILIIISKMNPAKNRWPALYPGSEAAAQAKWEDMNDAILGIGSTIITGVDHRISGRSESVDDGTGALNAAYDSGDGIHQNEAGRIVETAALRTDLTTIGVL